MIRTLSRKVRETCSLESIEKIEGPKNNQNMKDNAEFVKSLEGNNDMEKVNSSVDFK